MGDVLHIRVLQPLSSAYCQDVMRGIAAYARAHTKPQLWISTESRSVATVIERQGRLERIDGIIGHFHSTSELRGVVGWLPAVNVSNALDDVSLPKVVSDDMAAGRLAARHLLDRGFRQFAYCRRSGSHFGRQREEGFRQEIADAGIATPISIFIEESLPPLGNDARWLRWVAGLPRPIGVFCANDSLARRVVALCQTQRMRIPEEIAVIGGDNNEGDLGLSLTPLSSVASNGAQIGYEATAVLMKLIRGEQVRTTTLVAPIGVIARHSTDVMAVEDPHIAKVMKLIWQHACKGISIDDILETVPLSRRTLELRFRKALACSPYEAIQRTRIEQAKRLLAETDLSVSQIARQCGYSDCRRLCVAFRKLTQQTPGSYRVQHRVGLRMKPGR